jgi:hypothetical protein
MLSITLFLLVFFLFRFNRNIETLGFGIEITETNYFETNQNKQKKTEKPYIS